MSGTLMWIQTEVPASHGLSDELKFALTRRKRVPLDEIMNERSLGYLQGLHDGGIRDAQKLIKAIEKHGEIRVFEEFG